VVLFLQVEPGLHLTGQGLRVFELHKLPSPGRLPRVDSQDAVIVTLITFLVCFGLLIADKLLESNQKIVDIIQIYSVIRLEVPVVPITAFVECVVEMSL
jgi:hypothetical protein